MTGWSGDLADWWIGESASDPVYRTQVLPLALALLDPRPGERYLDLGCGEGPLLRELAGVGATAIGMDASVALARRAADHSPTVVGLMPELGFIRDRAVDGVAIVLVLEHVEDAGRLLAEAHRVTRPGGALVLVVNHPLLTAPGSGPFLDPDDGEVLWRWGSYLSGTHTDEPAGDGTVRFHHRSLSELMSAAASAGWALQRMTEVGYDPHGADPLFAVQSEVPRLLGARWVRPG
ncbi:MAG: methyltransferase domain-containing protein [Acidimicrobiia bacterium]